MDGHHEQPSLIKRFLYFFPVQLLLLHLKRNHLILLFWIILFGYVNGFIGDKYGLTYLFLAPEYQGEINWLSFGILGFATGGFFMAFNMYSYIMHGYKFRFIATIARPFYKFAMNNSLLPWVFVINYLIQSGAFLHKYQLMPWSEIVFNLSSYLSGITIFIVMSVFYFFRTNKDIVKLRGKQKDQPVSASLHNSKKWYEAFMHDQEWNVRSYFSSPFKISIARDIEHYDESLIREIFSQNRINASFFEIIMIISFIVLGTFKETEWVMIPAGASIMLLMTVMIMLISILYSWLRGWTVTAVIALIYIFHLASNEWNLFRYKSYAYGLDYTEELADYTHQNVRDLSLNPNLHTADSLHTILRLENWKERTGEEKPKMILVSTSGGGSRSALWTFWVLQHLDRESDGKFLKHVPLITGSSGGMIGAAYYRELALRDGDEGASRLEDDPRENIGSDLLNSVAVTIATTDMLFRYQTFKVDRFTYTKDRGYMFERRLNQITDNVMNKRLHEYYHPVFKGKIPMMILAPAITNDGRRLLISSQPLAYMSKTYDESEQHSVHTENIEFRRLFADQGADNLVFTSALRMNATFPYVMPMVSLPSKPSIEVMDAGLRDNYGIKDLAKFLFTFREWIAQNTSGIIVVQIRDRKKEFDINHQDAGSLLKRVVTPFSNVYGNIIKVQDYTDDELMAYAMSSIEHPIHIASFDLMRSTEENISLSWHLTQLEKQRVHKSIFLPTNNSATKSVLDELDVIND